MVSQRVDAAAQTWWRAFSRVFSFLCDNLLSRCAVIHSFNNVICGISGMTADVRAAVMTCVALKVCWRWMIIKEFTVMRKDFCQCFNRWCNNLSWWKGEGALRAFPAYLAWFLGSHSEPLWLLHWSRTSSNGTSHCDALTSSSHSEQTENPAGTRGVELWAASEALALNPAVSLAVFKNHYTRLKSDCVCLVPWHVGLWHKPTQSKILALQVCM